MNLFYYDYNLSYYIVLYCDLTALCSGANMKTKTVLGFSHCIDADEFNMQYVLEQMTAFPISLRVNTLNTRSCICTASQCTKI